MLNLCGWWVVVVLVMVVVVVVVRVVIDAVQTKSACFGFKDSHKYSFRQLCTLNGRHWLLCGLNRCISRLLGELHLKMHFVSTNISTCSHCVRKFRYKWKSTRTQQRRKSYKTPRYKTVYHGLAQIYQIAYLEYCSTVYKYELMLKQCRNAQYNKKKSRIRETLILSTDADHRTRRFRGGRGVFKKQIKKSNNWLS